MDHMGNPLSSLTTGKSRCEMDKGVTIRLFDGGAYDAPFEPSMLRAEFWMPGIQKIIMLDSIKTSQI